MSDKINRKISRGRMTVPRRVSESGEDLCPVCSEVVTFYAVGKCDHFVCYRCCTRMRSLCDQMYCAICRTELPKVIFVKSLKKFEEIDTYHFLVNRRIKVSFENDTIQQAFNELLDHCCPLCPGRKPFRGFPNLRDHMRKDHNLHYCDLCVGNLKIFTHERKFYDRKKLAEHRRVGDEDDKSHKGHPLCEFCDERFLDNDELVRHLRKEHYFCHFCDADGISNQFYSDYPVLRHHFKESHHMCEEDDCAHAQFTNAFRSDIDLKAHKATEHGKGMRKAQQKQMRAVDIDFSFTPRAGGARRYDRGGGRRDYQRRDDHQRDDGRRDFQRRDQGSNSGTVTGADYEEVNQESDRRGGHQQRTKRQQRQVDREAEDTARALAASLSEMQRSSHVNVVDEALVRPVTSVETKKGEKYQESSRDFPTLDGKVIEEDRTSDEDVASGKDPGKPARNTMAKKVARANMFSVAEGNVGSDDFPSLGGGTQPFQPPPSSSKPARNKDRPVPKKPVKPSVNEPAHPHQWQVPDLVTDFPSLGGGTAKPVAAQSSKVSQPAKPAQNTVSAAPRQAPIVEDEFPALGGGNKMRKGFPLKQNTWVSSAPPTNSSNKKAVPKAAQNKPVQQKPLSQNKTQPQPKASTFEEYPTLGSIGGSLLKTLSSKGTTEDILAKAPVPSSHSATSNIRVVKATNEVPTSNAMSSNKPVKMDESDFPTLGGKSGGKNQAGAKWGPKPKKPEPEEEKSDKQENQFMVAKLKNKNKNKNKREVFDDFASGSDSETKSSRSVSSKGKVQEDDYFDYEIHSKKVEKPQRESEKTSSSKSKKKKGQKENKSSAGTKESETPINDTKVPLLKPSEPQPADDFPALNTLKDQSNLPSRVADLNLDEFPSLSSSLVPAPEAAPPPPGLSKKPAAPPGFSFSSVSSSAPPPGFSSLGNIITQVNVEPEVIQEPAHSDGGNGEPVSYEYTQPPSFMERNHKLIGNIQRYVKNDEAKFNEFKSCSGDFRKDKIGPYDYYDRCSNIIGKDGFRVIFPELLALLPDISKQQELLNAHNAAIRLSQGKKSQGKSNKKAMWSTGDSPLFVSCSVCKQVLLQKDFGDHQKCHNLESDFPSLGSTTTAGSGYGLSAWVKAK